MDTKTPTRTFRYTWEIDSDSFSSADLREIANECEETEEGHLNWAGYRIEIFDAAGNQTAESAEMLTLHTEGRTGIAWGAEADWFDSFGDPDKDIAFWLSASAEDLAGRN